MRAFGGQGNEQVRNITETVGNTPVVRINRLAPPDVNLYVKVEAFNPLGSVKDRLALGVIEEAERTGKLKPGQTVVEATSGNTGIGLAMVCAAKGYPLVVTMAETFSIERRKLMRFLGARVVITPAAARAVGMVKKTVELAEKHGWYYTRQFENEANADMHSRTTAQEILRDFKDERLDYWVTGFGTGGTLKGVARVLAKERPETKIVVCEPDDAPMLSSGIEQERNQTDRRVGSTPELEAASDAGLEPGFRRKARWRRDLIEGDQPGSSDHQRRCDALQQGAGEEGRDLCRHHLRGHVRRGAAGGGAGAQGSDHSLHVAGYRRALPEHSAVCGRIARHERGGVGDRPFHARMHPRTTKVVQRIARSTQSHRVPHSSLLLA